MIIRDSDHISPAKDLIMNQGSWTLSLGSLVDKYVQSTLIQY